MHYESPLAKPKRPWVYTFVRHLAYETCANLWNTEVYGVENIPHEGPFILAANHLSFLDPPFIGSCLPRRIYYLARESLFETAFMGWLLDSLHCIRLKRESSGDVSAVKTVLKLLRSGQSLLLFPEGTRSPDGKPQTPKAGVGLIACMAQVPVIPAHISGTFEALGRKNALPNFEHPIRIDYHRPILPEVYDPGPKHPERYRYAMEVIMEGIKGLRGTLGVDAASWK